MLIHGCEQYDKPRSSLSDTSSLETGQQSLTDGSVYSSNDCKSNVTLSHSKLTYRIDKPHSLCYQGFNSITVDSTGRQT